jgi:hypothetical protein
MNFIQSARYNDESLYQNVKMDTYDDSFDVWFGVSDPNFEVYDNPYITVDFLTQTGGKPRPAPHISLKRCDESGF